MAKNMKKKDAKDFASTKHEGLPEKTKCACEAAAFLIKQATVKNTSAGMLGGAIHGGMMGAGVGALVAALSRLRKNKDSHLPWLKSLLVGGAIGGGAGISKATADLLTSRSKFNEATEMLGLPDQATRKEMFRPDTETKRPMPTQREPDFEWLFDEPKW